MLVKQIPRNSRFFVIDKGQRVDLWLKVKKGTLPDLNFIERLKALLQKPLPGIEAQAEMSPVRGNLKTYMDKWAGARKSAVLVPLYFKNDDLQIIIIQRAEYPGVHSGQFAFPGGRVEEVDLDTEATALRECEEEIGLSKNDVQVLGSLTKLFIPPSNSLVDVYLAFVPKLPELVLQESEVQRTVHFPISTLLDDSIVKYSNNISVKGLALKEVPYFEIDGNVVWGATASMLNELKVLLRQLQ